MTEGILIHLVQYEQVAFEATAWLTIPESDDFQAAQKELTRLQTLIGQHDELLSTLHEERAQEKEDNPQNSSVVATLWQCRLENSRLYRSTSIR